MKKSLEMPLKTRIENIAIIEDDLQISDWLTAEISLQIMPNTLRIFNNGLEAVEDLVRIPADIALFDLNLPGLNGIECIRRLKMIHPRMQVIVLTVYDNAETIFDALKAGATGYLLKSTTSEKIIEAIYEVYHGGSPISSPIARKVIEAFQVREKTNDYFQDLSRREQEILEQLNNGYRYKEIADKLFLSVDTIRTHIRNIYEKLQVNSKVEALKKTGFL